MNLPVRERARYSAAPLIEVICQLRFPRQLELQDSPPVAFQRTLKEFYPLLETRDAVTIQVFGFPDANDLNRSPLREIAYDFFDAQRTHKVTITSEFLAVTTAAYSGWEDFQQHAARATAALLECYKLPLFTRIGLRYQNLITPANYGLKRVRATALFAREILGPMTVLAENLREHQSVTTVGVSGGGAANLRFAASGEGTEARSYVLDCDVFTEGTTKAELNDALGQLDRFHSEASNIFRWCIKERLHDALGPEPC